MPKHSMSDAQLKSLLAKASSWLRENDERAARQVALRKGGKVKIPKKPLKATGKKTVPSKLDWGKGVTKDKLAYINADEEKMLRARRGDAPVRKVRGIPAFAEEEVGPGGGGHKGGGGGGGGGGGSAAGSGSGSGSSSGASSSPSNSGSSSEDKKTSSGPSRGPTDAPAAVGPSKASSAPSAPTTNSFGPREGTGLSAKDPTQSAASQASKVAADAAINAVAKGSIANPATGSAAKSITDRVPQASTVGGLSPASQNSAASKSLGKEDIFAGANSPMADKAVNSYDRNAMDAANMASAAKASALADNTGLLGPSVPAGTAKANVNTYAGQPTTAPNVSAAMTASAKAIQDRVPQSTTIAPGPSIPSVTMNPQTGLAMGEKFQDRLPGSVNAVPTGDVPDYPGVTTVAMNNIGDAVKANNVAADLYGAPIGPSQGMKLSADAQRNVFGGDQRTKGLSGADVAKASNPSATFDEAMARDAISNVVNGAVSSPSATKAIDDRLVNVNGKMFGVTPDKIAQNEQPVQDAWNSYLSTYSNPATFNPDTPAPMQQISSVQGKTRGLSPEVAPSGMHQAALAQGLAPATNPTLASVAQPYGGPMAAADASPVRSDPVAAAVTAASVPSVAPHVGPVSPVEQVEAPPSNPYGIKMEQPFSKVGNAVTPALNAVDDFLGRLLGSNNSAYQGQLANGEDGSNGPVNPPGGMGGGGPNIAALLASSKGKGKGKVALPPLPPYVNYQHVPGVNYPPVTLPPASQPIVDFIDHGYADGGAIKPMTAYGVHGASALGSGLAPTAMPPQTNTPPPATGSNPTTPPPTTPPGNPWGLEDPTAPGNGAGKNPFGPDSNYMLSGSGKVVPNYANMDHGQILSGWLNDQMKGMAGNKGVLPNMMELFARLDAGGFHGRHGQKGPETNGPTPDPNNPNPNKDALTGYGKPGGWSANKNGWRRGGAINDSVAAALRVALGLR
jgi:hypothetical protein